MKKAIKIVAWTLGVLLVLVVALVATLPLWIKPVVTGVANAAGPEMTKTEFHLGQFALNPYTGHFAMGDLQVANPKDFKEKMAITLGSISVDVDMGSLFGDTVVIKEVLIKDVFASYVSNDAGTNNVDAIMANVMGSVDKARAEAQEGMTAEEKARDDKEAEEARQEVAKRKVIIDHVRIQGVKAKWKMLPIPLPPIDLKGIGRESNGVALSDACAQIWSKILAALTSVGANLKDLGIDSLSLMGDAAKAVKLDKGAEKTVAALEDAAKAVRLDKGAEAAKESLKDAGNALKSLFK